VDRVVGGAGEVDQSLGGGGGRRFFFIKSQGL
jgi:hypothetical protein